MNTPSIQIHTWALALLFAVNIQPVWAAATPIEPDEQGIQRATITLDSYSYSPNDITVHVGKPVELTFRNNATFAPHTFVLDDPAADLRLQVEVSAGESKSVSFTPTHPGTFTFYCDKKLLFFKSHRERGQEGHLEIR